MAEKVKVSREVAWALQFIEKRCSFEEIMRKPSEGGWIGEDLACLNRLTLKRVAEILINGYEIEETPEERILRKYNENYETACTTPNMREQWKANGFNSGIRFVLNRLEMKIKGINE